MDFNHTKSLSIGADCMSHSTDSALYFHNVNYSVDDIPILKGITGSFPKEKSRRLSGHQALGKRRCLKCVTA